MDLGDKLKMMQIEFFERLWNNNYTKEIVKEIFLEEKDNSYIDSLLKTLNETEYTQGLDFLDRCKHYKFPKRLEFETNKKKPKVVKLKEIFKKHNGKRTKLYEALRYDRALG
jgi:hypothetical protein